MIGRVATQQRRDGLADTLDERLCRLHIAQNWRGKPLERFKAPFLPVMRSQRLRPARVAYRA
jgi:hypothetical protein